MLSEREMQISPIVQDSVVHNTKTLTNLHNLTASLFGVGAGILGLESYFGFLFYFLFSFITSALVYVLRVRPAITQAHNDNIHTSSGPNPGPGKGIEHGEGVGRYFRSGLELWTGGLLEGLSGFVLTWTLFYGLRRLVNLGHFFGLNE